jgi:hypothetical protein
MMNTWRGVLFMRDLKKEEEIAAGRFQLIAPPN